MREKPADYFSLYQFSTQYQTMRKLGYNVVSLKPCFRRRALNTFALFRRCILEGIRAILQSLVNIDSELKEHKVLLIIVYPTKLTKSFIPAFTY